MNDIQARRLFSKALPPTWKAATAGGGGITIITTPEGKIGTVCVYEYEKGVFRFALNTHTARRRGTHNAAIPKLTPRCEVTVAESEVPAAAAWLTASIVASTLLPSPIKIDDSNDPAYIWTAKASALGSDEKLN